MDGSGDPLVAVVIPAKNAAHHIADQMAALAAQDIAARIEIIISDNGSDDATAKIASQWSAHFARLAVVDSSHAPGVSGARNVGTGAATTPFVLYCDADDLVDPTWARSMLEALADADLVGGRIDMERLNAPEVIGWYQPLPADALPVALDYLPYAVGANLGVRLELFHRLGGFDRSFAGGHEEVDFAWRAQQLGARVAFAGDALVHYRLRSDLRPMARQRFAYGRTSAQLAYRHRHVPIRRVALRRKVATLRHLLTHPPHHVLAPPDRATPWRRQ